MNQKASKQQLISKETPPLLSMAEDRPHVDNEFRNWEENNTPFINNMMSPLYVHENDGEVVYDKAGHEYTIEDNYLKRDGVSISYINPNKFVREDITDEVSQYYNYYEDDNVKLGSIWVNNHLSFEWKEGGILHTIDVGDLFLTGNLSASRLVIRESNGTKYGVWVALAYHYNSQYNKVLPYVMYVKFTSSGVAMQKDCITAYWDGEYYDPNYVNFTNYVARSSASASINEYWDDLSDYEDDCVVSNPDPVINIGVISDGHIAFSLVSNFGKAIPCMKNGFITFVDDGSELHRLGYGNTGDNKSLKFAEVSTTTQEQTGEWINYFKQTLSRRSSQVNSSCIKEAGGSTYYEYGEGTKGAALDIPTTYFPVDTGQTIVIDEVTYNIYSYSAVKYTYIFNAYIQNYDQVHGTWEVNLYNGDGTLYANSGSILSDNWSQTYELLTFRGETPPQYYWDLSLTSVDWAVTDEAVGEITLSVLGAVNQWVALTRHYMTTVTVSPIALPTVVLDNGNFYLFLYGTRSGTAWNQMPIGGVLVESGRATYNNGLLTIIPIETVTLTASYNCYRSSSYVVNQNLFQTTMRLCNASAVVPASAASGSADPTSSRYLEYTNSNTYDLKYGAGTSTDNTFNYYTPFADSPSGSTNDALCYTIVGMRTEAVPGSNFKILYNVLYGNSALTQSISWASSDDNMGTLVAPWATLDEDFYISAGLNKVVYKDNAGNVYRISVVSGNELKTFLDDRYIFINTTSYYNMYDSQSRRLLHYASDYNGRLLHGSTEDIAVTTWSGAVSTSSGTSNSYNTRTTANAINGAYKIQPRLATGSIILPAVTRLRCRVADETVYGSNIPESSTQAQGIDVYYSNANDSSTVKYRYTIVPYASPSRYVKYDLDGSTYEATTASATFVNTNVFSTILNGAGNNDMVEETYENYTLVYYNTYPYFLYNVASATANVNTNTITGTSSSTTTQGKSDFFVIQGQFYGVINDKLYSLIYSNGAISSMDAIVDVRGFKFVGNNPMIAFFWSPSMRAFYSFTGDANLTHIYNGNKFSDIPGDYWYDESTQSIFIATNRGLLVFGPKNTYLLTDYTDVTNVQFTDDGLTHITSGGKTDDISYYPRDNFVSKHLIGETSFYGLGSTESTSIDRWNITIYDQTESNPSGEITVGVRSLTDITVKSEEKKYKITPEMWDKWGHSILLAYNPKLIKGQGIRLYIDSPWNVTSIVPHIMDNGAGTTTRRSM